MQQYCCNVDCGPAENDRTRPIFFGKRSSSSSVCNNIKDKGNDQCMYETHDRKENYMLFMK